MSEEMKKKTVLYIVIGILIISLIFMGGLILKQQTKITNLEKSAKESNKNTSNKEKEEEKEETKEPTEQNESEILSDNIKNKLNKNMEYLNYLGKEQFIDNTNFYVDNKNASSYSEREKLGAIILASIAKNQNEYIEQIALEPINEELFKEIFPNDNVEDFKNSDGTIEGTYLIDNVEISNRYKEIFGDFPTGMESSLKCPFTNYYKPQKKYVVSMANCGGTNPLKDLSYNYRYTSQGEKYYVYVSMGIFNIAEGIVYRDYAMKDIFNKNVEDFKIDSTNYQEFSQFKVTFEKRNENYIFRSIEKLNKD